MKKNLRRAVAMLLAIFMVMPLLVFPTSAYSRNDTLESGHSYTLLTALNRNKALDLRDNDAYPQEGFPNIQIWDNNWTTAQVFTIEWISWEEGKSWYRIIHSFSGKVLDVEGVNSDPGANIILCDWNGGWNQLWAFEKTDDGGYRIKSRLGTYLDVRYGSTDNATNVWAYSDSRNVPWYNNKSQIWYLEDVTLADARRINANGLATTDAVWLQKGKSTTVTLQYRGLVQTWDNGSGPLYLEYVVEMDNGKSYSKANNGLSCQWGSYDNSLTGSTDDGAWGVGTQKLILNDNWANSPQWRNFRITIKAKNSNQSNCTTVAQFKVIVY